MNIMPNKPLVSIIVTSFNRCALLKQTLLSIINQTYSNLEIIVVDDGSHDGSTEMVETLNDERIQFYVGSHAGRPAIPRNIGLTKACGELIAFCDDDDLWEPEKISLQVNEFIKNPKIQLCYTDRRLIDELGAPITEGNTNSETVSYISILKHNSITFSSVMISQKCIINHRFDERKFLRASEDFLFVSQLVAAAPIAHIKQPLVAYRIHQQGISYSKNNIRKLVRYYFRIVVCLHHLLKTKHLKVRSFIHLVLFHLKHTAKQIIFPFYQRLKLFRKTNG